MTKVAIFGASGQSGVRIQAELLSRGHSVVAIVRDPTKVVAADRVTVKVGNASDSVETIAALLDGVDVLVNAYAPPHDSTDDLIPFTQKLVDAVTLAQTPRLLMVGGAGGLQVAPGELVINQPWFPESYKPIAQSHIDALEVLRASSINWTTLSPAGVFGPGERTGVYRLDKEFLVATPDGQSRISTEDYAIALVNEIETPEHERERFTVGY